MLTALLIPTALAATPLAHFDVEASYEAPAGPHEDGAVAVKFFARDPDLRLNATPAPRLKLDILETALIDRQGPPPRDVPDYDPLTAKYLDLAQPVRFPVDIHSTDPGQSKGIAPSGVRARPYDVPYRALIARDVGGLLLAGRCISGDFICFICRE